MNRLLGGDQPGDGLDDDGASLVLHQIQLGRSNLLLQQVIQLRSHFLSK